MELINKKPVFKIAFLGLCLALYIALSFVSIDLQFFKITFLGIPLILVSVLYGPVEGILVGALGEFICQAVSKYGLTITTPLWILPAILRALIVGLMFKKKDYKDHIVLWIFTMLLSGIAVTLLNTFVIYLDALIFEYPSALTNATILFRLVGSVITSAIYGLVLPLIFEVLKAFHKVEKKTE